MKSTVKLTKTVVEKSSIEDLYARLNRLVRELEEILSDVNKRLDALENQ